jgi:hypothetical protein
MRTVFERWTLLSALLGGLVGASGCSPKIGDKCSVSTDCSQQGDRLCDPTQPGGYCTIFNCEPNRCPDEAVCVAFNEPSCSSSALSRRFQRTFCMFVCESNDDCRAGYACIDTTNDPSRQVVDQNPQSRQICAVPPSGAMPTTGPDPAVCLSPDGGPVSEGGPDDGSGVDGGTDGESDGRVRDGASEGPLDEGEAGGQSSDGPIE